MTCLQERVWVERLQILRLAGEKGEEEREGERGRGGSETHLVRPAKYGEWEETRGKPGVQNVIIW